MRSLGIVASGHKAGGVVFDPLSIGWAHAFWAEDPGWSNPGDGNAVASWNNAGTTGNDAVQATSTIRPTYRASYSNLGNRPALEFDGGDVLVAASALSQPNHIYAVGYLNPAVGASPTLTDGAGASRHLLRTKNGTAMQMYAGVSAAPGTAVTGGLQVAALFNATASTLRCNGQSITGLSVGTQGLNPLMIGADHSTAANGNNWLGAIAFLGVKNSALTAGELSDLSTWAASYYGVSSL